MMTRKCVYKYVYECVNRMEITGWIQTVILHSFAFGVLMLYVLIHIFFAHQLASNAQIEATSSHTYKAVSLTTRGAVYCLHFQGTRFLYFQGTR